MKDIKSAKYILLSTVTCVSFNNIKRTVSWLHVNECWNVQNNNRNKGSASVGFNVT